MKVSILLSAKVISGCAGEYEHGIIGGPEGAVIIDIFAPARPEYTKPGHGFAGQSDGR